MPAIIAHWVFGEELAARLKERGTELASIDNYLWGSQGPDLLFFHRLMPWLLGKNYRKYGDMMHSDKPSALFEALIEYLNKKCAPAERPTALSYALGVCAHYALDRNAHPYVNWLDAELIKKAPRGKDYHYHGEIESALDEIVLKDWRGRGVGEMHLCDCLPTDDSTRSAISGAYEYLLDKIYDAAVDRKSTDQIVPDELAAYRLLDDHGFKKRPVFEKLERIAGIKTGPLTAYMRAKSCDVRVDYANKKHRTWNNIHEQGVSSSEDFSQIMRRSLDYGVEFTEYFLHALAGGEHDFAAYTEERTFSYGVPSTPELR